MTKGELRRVLGRVISFYKLREKEREDTIGVLMKCGAYELMEDGIDDLAALSNCLDYDMSLQ